MPHLHVVDFVDDRVGPEALPQHFGVVGLDPISEALLERLLERRRNGDDTGLDIVEERRLFALGHVELQLVELARDALDQPPPAPPVCGDQMGSKQETLTRLESKIVV